MGLRGDGLGFRGDRSWSYGGGHSPTDPTTEEMTTSPAAVAVVVAAAAVPDR